MYGTIHIRFIFTGLNCHITTTGAAGKKTTVHIDHHVGVVGVDGLVGMLGVDGMVGVDGLDGVDGAVGAF